jgi:uncharacterized membrane protein YhaH (DUF805 family)
MPNLITLLTTFSGRINRAKWWLGFVIIMAANVIGGLLLNPEFYTAEGPPPPSWPDTLWQIALLVPAMAISAKRFHDINWPGWVAPICASASLLFYLPPHFGVMIEPGAPAPGTAVFWLVVVVQLFGLIVNGFVIGTDGPNRYGPDPLDRTAKAT